MTHVRRGLRTVIFATAVLALLGSAAASLAHDRSVSYSTWRLGESGASVRVKVSRLDLTRLALDPVGSVGDAERAAGYLADRVRLYAGEARCPVSKAASMLTPSAEQRTSGWLIFSWSVACATSGAHTIESSFLLEVAPSHLHFTRASVPGLDGHNRVRVLSEPEPRWTLSSDSEDPGQSAAGATSVGGYVLLGISHILSGWDHLAFVIALLLLAGSLKEVAGLVTGFTIAHSVTLGLATLGVLNPDSAGVEALIGLSIALVAAENAWILAGRPRALPILIAAGLGGLALFGGELGEQVMLVGIAVFALCHFELLRRAQHPTRLRVALAFAFGLIHGFGFAGVLSELSLAPGQVVPALFGFNLGVEIGQLGVVVLAWPLLRGLHHLGSRPGSDGPAWGRLTAEFGSAGICGLGLFWFVTRHFG